MSTVISRYQFREQPGSFSIEGEDRPAVQISFRPTGLEAWYVGQSFAGSRARFGFFNFGKLLEFVARGLLRDWQPQEGWYAVRSWAEQQTSKAIARRLREHWLRLVAQATPTIIAVQKAIFAATFGDAPLAEDLRLYEKEYLVSDILRFPAAAIAVRNAYTLTRDQPINRLLKSEEVGQLKQLAQSLGLKLYLSHGPIKDLDLTTQLEQLSDWKSLFSDTGRDYRSLNRTLMNLPGRIPHRLVCNLRYVHLERPIESRLELLAVVLYAGIRHEREETPLNRVDHSHLFHHARSREIKVAMQRLAAHQRQTLDPRKAGHVKQLVTFLADYPEPHTGNIVGLTERAIRWHRDQQHEQLVAMRRQHGERTLTVRPPIALPEHSEIRFLDTVGAICEEAERMHHCVASYIDLAVQGNCYLFHVRYKDEEATVEVGCEGKVRQSQGPRNQRNRASAWGKRILSRWAGQLPHAGPMTRTYSPLIEDEIPF